MEQEAGNREQGREQGLSVSGETALAVVKDQYQIFETWKNATGRNGTTTFTPKRRDLLTRWLKIYPLETLLAAAVGVTRDPFNSGDNDKGKKYDSLELVFRDEEHIERFAGYELEPTTRPTGHKQGNVERDVRSREIDPELLRRVTER